MNLGSHRLTLAAVPVMLALLLAADEVCFAQWNMPGASQFDYGSTRSPDVGATRRPQRGGTLGFGDQPSFDTNRGNSLFPNAGRGNASSRFSSSDRGGDFTSYPTRYRFRMPGLEQRGPSNAGDAGSGDGPSGATEVSTSLRLGFVSASRASTQVQSTLAGRLARAAWIQTLGPLEVEMRGQTAVLRGRVATPHDRLLAQRLAMLEPGVRHVRNEIEVDSQRPPAPQS